MVQDSSSVIIYLTNRCDWSFIENDFFYPLLWTSWVYLFSCLEPGLCTLSGQNTVLHFLTQFFIHWNIEISNMQNMATIFNKTTNNVWCQVHCEYRQNKTWAFSVKLHWDLKLLDLLCYVLFGKFWTILGFGNRTP